MTAAERIAGLLAASALLVLAPAVARGQSDDASIGAEALFREGKRLMNDHQVAAACVKFEASNRVEESVGTLLNLGDCHEKLGQLATSWATFLRAASMARAESDVRREAVARSRASALEPRLAYLTISVPEASHIDGLIIKRDGVVIDPGLWNTGIPIDTGSYQISGEAPGREPWSTKVEVETDGQKVSVEVPRFKQLKDLSAVVTARASDKAAPAPVAPPGPPDERGDRDDRPRRGALTTTRKIAIAAAAAGVGGLAGGVGFGLEARHLSSQSDAICPMTTCGDPHALDLNAAARRDLRTSYVLFGVGGAAVVGAAVLWFVGAPAHGAHGVALAPALGRGEVGLTLVGGF